MIWGLTSVAASLVALCSLSVAEDPPADAECQHGFRHDPMPFVQKSESVDAALARRHVFKKPRPGDKAILDKRIAKILTGLKDDGRLADGIKDTAQIALSTSKWPEGVTQVGRELWVYDSWFGCVMRVDPAQPDTRRFHGHTGGGCRITARGESILCVQDFAPLILRTSTAGKLLDWAEAPFAGRCDGLAWDGKHLWALDAKGGRICVVERTERSGT